MSKNLKIHPGKKQLSLAERTMLEKGFNLKKRDILGRPTIIQGVKCFDGFRIIQTTENFFLDEIGISSPNENVYIYNNQGKLLTQIHNGKLKNY